MLERSSAGRRAPGAGQLLGPVRVSCPAVQLSHLTGMLHLFKWRISQPMTRQQAQRTAQNLAGRGFDRCSPAAERDGLGRFTADWAVTIGCSQCEALAICGIACHETGCPNGQSLECFTCGEKYYGPNRREMAGECCQASGG